MNKQEKAMQAKLLAAIGGEWNPTDPTSDISGLIAQFPRFRSEAIVAVLNGLAETCAAEAQVIAQMPKGEQGLAVDDPNFPRDVIVPMRLIENPHFQMALTENLKEQINEQTSAMLSHSVGTGMNRYLSI